MKVDFSRIMSLLALRCGDRPAIVNVERDRRYTFREYHALTNRIANAMRGTLGLKQGDVALAILDNDNLTLLHFPTIFKQACMVAFSNFRDTISEHLWQVDLVEPKVVFLEASLLEAYREPLLERNCIIVVMDRVDELPAGVLDFWDLVEGSSDENPAVELDVHEHVSVLRFTGGTTGRGKCAMYTIDNFSGTRDGAYIHPDFGFSEHVRFLHLAPISHGSLLFFWPTFFAGGTTYTLNTPDISRWCSTVQAEAITHSFLVPTLMYRLADMNAVRTHDLSSLRILGSGAAPIAPARLSQLVEQFGSIFVQIYAATESIMFVSALGRDDHRTGDEASMRRLSSAGRVFPGLEVVIADDDGRELPVGETGEIRLRSRATIRGYYRNPEATRSEFRDGFWLSGDLGYIDECGFLFIVDRKKDMIITGGFNVYAVEIEAALLTHPAVSIAAVVGRPHPEWGEAVHAEVVLKAGESVSEEDLIAYTKAKVGSYKAPKSVAFVDELPLSSAGKVMRRVVREQYWKDQDRRVG